MTKVAVITGVTGGIGMATAELFRNNGWDVIGIDIKDVSDHSVLSGFILADVSVDADIGDAARDISEKYGKVDTLINNAALQICKPLVETTPDEWDAVLATNLRSVYSTARHFHPLLNKHGSSIVNVSSVHALVTSSSISAYAASKGAMVALTRSLAIEFAEDNIRVNAVLPGAVDTKMLHAGLDRGHAGKGELEQKLLHLAGKTVMKRIGRPDEIAQSILFMADDTLSSYITGQTLVVDGGATIKLSTE